MQKNYAKRRARLSKKLRSVGIEAILITNLTNVAYLTGFSGSSAYLLATAKEHFLLSDFRYKAQIEDECDGLNIVIRTASSEMVDSVAKTAKSLKLKTMAIESAAVSKSQFDVLNSKLNCELVDTGGWVEDLRAIKDKQEIELIRNSIFVNQKSFEVIRAQLHGGQTEKDLAHNLEHQMRTFGATGCAFDPIVGVGPRAALPHGKPSDKKIAESPFVLIDWGAKVSGYASDLTRVLITGKISSKFEKVYNTVLDAQIAAIEKIRPGISLKEVDSAARTVIDKSGYGKYFGHGLGHGFGLEIHENPFMSPIKQGTLKANMVVTVEPGIYLPGWGGVRIEDDILVTEDGYEILSNLPKQLNDCVVAIT